MTPRRRLVVRVIDDAPGLARSMALLLHEYGHTALPTDAGFAALLNASAWVGVDAALVDLDLNNPTSGQVIIDWLIANAPRVRVVVLTGTGTRTLIDQSPRASLAVYATLLKPASIDVVLAALER